MKKNKFIVGQFYQNYRVSGLYMKIDKVLESNNYYTRLLVTWWKKDDNTQKKISMDLQQETQIPESEYTHWIRVS